MRGSTAPALTGQRMIRRAVVSALTLALAVVAFGCGGETKFTGATLCSEYNQGNVDSAAAAARQDWDNRVAARYGNFSNMTVSNIPQYCVQKPSASMNEATMAAVKAAGKQYSGMD